MDTTDPTYCPDTDHDEGWDVGAAHAALGYPAPCDLADYRQPWVEGYLGGRQGVLEGWYHTSRSQALATLAPK